jgi:hypothetical protein
VLRYRALTSLLLSSLAGSWGIAGCESSSSPLIADATDGGAEPIEAGRDPVEAGSDATTCALPVSFGSRKCNACMAENCCDLLAVCEADPKCQELLRCVFGKCTDELDAGGCTKECVAQTTDEESVKRFRTLEFCGFEEPCLDPCTTKQ